MKNKITLYFHCAECEKKNRPRTISMNDYARISVGWTQKGLQIWCNRCNRNVMAFDFLGQKIDYESAEE